MPPVSSGSSRLARLQVWCGSSHCAATCPVPRSEIEEVADTSVMVKHQAQRRVEPGKAEDSRKLKSSSGIKDMVPSSPGNVGRGVTSARSSSRGASRGGGGGGNDGVTLARSSVFEKWATMDRDAAQRPLAKRQLSDESKESVHPSGGVKKKSVAADRQQHAALGGWRAPCASCLVTRPTQSKERRQVASDKSCPTAMLTRRKLQRELLSSEDVFEKVDAHAVRVGKEMRSNKIYSLETITKTITEGAQSDLLKLRAIWIWLCHNIEYDVSGYLGLTKKVTSPEEVVETGRGVCCGYSSVLQQMCRVVGIECEEVSGHGKGVGYRQGQTFQDTKSSHMWNAVKLHGHWYLLDSCWGAGRVDLDNKSFIKRYDDFYFLTDPENFINSHCPDETEWQLLEEPIPMEEFEKRVFRTSEFYRLGLTLIHPKHFLLVTENGEATIAIGFSQPMEFTYQASLHSSNGHHVELSSPIGLLTVTKGSMKLKLMPPVSGTFDVVVFARPANTTGTFGWVCSFTLECPEPAPVEELPENPFLSWGLQQNSWGLGLKPCVYGSDAIVLESGCFELVLGTTRPLMVLCELTHKDLETTLAKQCLMTQIEPNQLTCHVLCPYVGYYRLSVFVRDYGSHGDGFQNAGNFLLRCTGGMVNLNELFPANLSPSCGPGVRTLDAGLSKFSHATSLLATQQGKCNITFHNSRDLELHAVLSKDRRKCPGHPLTRHVFLTYSGSKVTVSVALPESGIYKLSLYGKSASSDNQEFGLLCDFVLRNSSETSWPPFPCSYTAWQKGYVLFEPRTGLLEPDSWVRFRVRVPGAGRVSVQGEQRTELQLNKSRVWEGEVYTGNSASQLKLAAMGTAGSGDSCQNMNIIMSFDVLSVQNEL
ncbi:kyphoscoliosis peptidase-like [Engraulis encrasicolus]|uniref:kyphoscoliosis peptidase-like n=1 Tax=Engraulis encrasicolus TaxID=184585 RepID=UPI002FD00F31